MHFVIHRCLFLYKLILQAMALSNAEETADFDDDLVDIEALLDDTLMPNAS